jgi:hypothetical protein
MGVKCKYHKNCLIWNWHNRCSFVSPGRSVELRDSAKKEAAWRECEKFSLAGEIAPTPSAKFAAA